MPAVTVENPLVLPRIPRPDVTTAVARPVDTVIASTHTVEVAGFEVWRPFPGGLSLSITDPFLLLDQLGPVEYGPNEAKGAPWHPHRGFETVTYVLDGEISTTTQRRWWPHREATRSG
jgi:redox-sensitive bicupin YhaK (pirin superfamily)